MPSSISNAIGTERQFTPLPDAGYIGRYHGVSPSPAQAPLSASDQLAANMAQLSSALGSYLVSHEHYLNDKGSIEAERMIKGESEEDIRKLNVIDAAQQEGYADSLSNPYFKAYAERLRGGFLSTVMKEQYDEKYALDPARSAAEEAKRFNDFAKDWQKANLSGSHAPVNPTAFGAGFTENQLVHIGSLMTAWEKQDHENKITTTMANAKHQLGEIIKNSVELLKTNGATTDAVQEVFNELRLMGLPPAWRTKLLQDFVDDFIQTGHIDAERLGQMLDRVTVQTSLDGTRTNASELLDMQHTKTLAAEYNRQFHTQEKADFIDHYKNMGMQGKKEVRLAIEEMRREDPEKAREYNTLIPLIDQAIDAEIRRQQEARERAMRQTGRGRGAAGSKVSDSATAAEIIESWLSGSTFVNGKPVSSYTFDTDVLYSVALPRLQELIAAEDMENMHKLMDMPQLNKMRSTYSDYLMSVLSNIMPSDDGGVNIGGNESLMRFVKSIANNPAAIAHTFGGALAQEAYTLKTLTVAHGGGEWGEQQALRLYAEAHQTESRNPDVHKANKDLAENSMAGFTIDSVPSAHDIGHMTDTADFGLGCNDLVRSDLTKVWNTLLDAGYSEEQAQTQINRLVRDNYETYHWGVYPRSVHFNIGTFNDPDFFRQAVDTYIYETAGEETADTSATTIAYNPITQVFTFDCKTQPGRITTHTLAELRQEALRLARNYTPYEAAQEEGDDIDVINAKRSTMGVPIEDGVFDPYDFVPD